MKGSMLAPFTGIVTLFPSRSRSITLAKKGIVIDNHHLPFLTFNEYDAKPHQHKYIEKKLSLWNNN